MRKLNWAEVTEATGGTAMTPGAYELVITDVKDNESDQFVEIMYDVTAGEHKGRYDNATADEDWKHSFRQYYTPKAEPLFKRFLKELEHDNPNFSIEEWQVASDPKGLVGLNFGMLFGEFRYVSSLNGEARWRLDANRPLTLEQVRGGEFKVPAPRYSYDTDEERWNEAKNAPKGDGSTSSDYSDLPFI